MGRLKPRLEPKFSEQPRVPVPVFRQSVVLVGTGEETLLVPSVTVLALELAIPTLTSLDADGIETVVPGVQVTPLVGERLIVLTPPVYKVVQLASAQASTLIVSGAQVLAVPSCSSRMWCRVAVQACVAAMVAAMAVALSALL